MLVDPPPAKLRMDRSQEVLGCIMRKMEAWVVHHGVHVDALEVARQLDGETRALVLDALFRLPRLGGARALLFAGCTF